MRRGWRIDGREVGRIGLYATALALGTGALQWLDYRRMVRTQTQEIDLFLLALVFLAIGILIGRRLISHPPKPFDGNPQARAALGISRRELDVLHEIAAGRSTKEIARALGLSPNTVKTHIARLFEKLGASRRTEAINRARELGLVR